MNLNLSSPKSSKTLNYLLIAFFVVAVIGFSDASYLTIKHFQGTAPKCHILEGCDIVTSSKYSKILGIPVALLGSMYYFLMAALIVFYYDSRKKLSLKIAGYLTWTGFIMSIWFVYLQLFVLNSICVYCMGSAASSTTLFILGQIMLKLVENTE